MKSNHLALLAFFTCRYSQFTRDTGVQLCKSEQGGWRKKEWKRSKQQVVSFSAVTLCLLARPAVVRGGNSCELKQSVLVNHAAQCDLILSLSDKALVLVLV